MNSSPVPSPRRSAPIFSTASPSQARIRARKVPTLVQPAAAELYRKLGWTEYAALEALARWSVL